MIFLYIYGLLFQVLWSHMSAERLARTQAVLSRKSPYRYHWNPRQIGAHNSSIHSSSIAIKGGDLTLHFIHRGEKSVKSRTIPAIFIYIILFVDTNFNCFFECLYWRLLLDASCLLKEWLVSWDQLNVLYNHILKKTNLMIQTTAVLT